MSDIGQNARSSGIINTTMQGQVFKIHSDFYYVKSDNEDLILECKLREVLKKQKLKIKVGDFVETDKGGAIKKLLKRKNTLERPCISNLDMVAVVSSLMEPDIDYIQLNRYLIFLKYHKIPVLLCFNKDDLMNESELVLIKDKIKKIYEPLGYKTVFTSALYNDGLDEFKKLIKGKTIAFCGLSGVGKSSILNALNKSGNLKTGSVSEKNKRGRHTTRHCEIIEFDKIKIIDTPGFSRLTFDFILPKDLGNLFDEIKKYKTKCKFSDCLHEAKDEGCNVIKNLDKIDSKRYESYINFLKEAKEFKQKVTYEGQKEEDSFKINQDKNFVKISSKKRFHSRRKINQTTKNLKNLTGENEDD